MKYIALMRGINVGGTNKVPMKELKDCLAGAGLANVSTYINSGNVLFESDARGAELSALCERAFEERFGFFTRIAVISAPELSEALSHAPEWWDSDAGSKHNAIFVIPPSSASDIIAEVGDAKPEYERVEAYGQMIFWSAPVKTFSRTRWSKIVGTKAYKEITIRNANTAKKLTELSAK